MTRPSSGPPRRSGNPRAQQRVIRVLTEGRITERDYLRRWARRKRSSGVQLVFPSAEWHPLRWLIVRGNTYETTPAGIQSSMRSGAYSIPTSTGSCHRPSKKPGRAESKCRSPIRASSSGSCCTPGTIRPTSIVTTCNVFRRNSASRTARRSPTQRGGHSSRPSKPRSSAPGPSMNAMPATAPRVGRIPVRMCGGSWISSTAVRNRGRGCGDRQVSRVIRGPMSSYNQSAHAVRPGRPWC